MDYERHRRKRRPRWIKTRIEGSRELVLNLIKDLPAEALNWRPIERTDVHEVNSMAVMATHVAGAEHFWIAEVIGRRPPTRERPAEFETAVQSAAELVAIHEKQRAETAEILAGLTEADMAAPRRRDDHDITVRWALVHVIDHYALHLGHMQITYQLWRGGEAFQAPRWHERLKEGD